MLLIMSLTFCEMELMGSSKCGKLTLSCKGGLEEHHAPEYLRTGVLTYNKLVPERAPEASPDVSDRGAQGA